MAIEDIRKDEIVGIKDGYIIDRKLLEEMGGLKSKVGEGTSFILRFSIGRS